MNEETKPITDPADDTALTPEIRAIMGIYTLYAQVQASIDAIGFDDGLTDPARRLLIRLEHPQRMGELARITKLLPPTVTAQADLLEVGGMVERRRDPNDRRAWILALTERGKTTRAELVRRAGELFRRVTGFEEAEIAAFAALTDKARKTVIDTIIDGSDQC